ncbi:ChaN family lipoprotein [Orrella sp. 11846]|uniref:ChaN family lipoprotein n=1 Tax=Orrella sp. 11846 TaxID=3409913 RepID=UPI003B5C8104
MKTFKPWVMKSCVSVLAALAMGSVVAPAAAQAPEKDIWLMGEVHDNPNAHFFRLKAIEKALGGDWRPALVMEQFNTDRQPELTQAWQTCKTAQCVINKAAEPGTAWHWDYYKPLITLALKYRLPLVAGNLSRAQLKEVMKDGYSAVFDAQTINRFGLKNSLPVQLADQQRVAIDVGHCNKLDATTINDMIKAQVARDVNFAKLIDQYSSQGVVLVAGNNHVRRDIGVMQWLQPAVASRVVVSGYVESGGIEDGIYDILHLVEPVKRADLCAKVQ